LPKQIGIKVPECESFNTAQFRIVKNSFHYYAHKPFGSGQFDYLYNSAVSS